MYVCILRKTVVYTLDHNWKVLNFDPINAAGKCLDSGFWNSVTSCVLAGHIRV
jgi:hypothetical protein